MPAEPKVGNAYIKSGEASTAGFRLLKKSEHPTIIAGLWGTAKMYKTGLAYDFPEPIWHLNLDRDAEPLAAHVENKEVHVQDILVPPDEELDPDIVGDILAEFMSGFKGALAKGEGTIVIDTVSVLWQLVQIFVLKGVMAKRLAAYEKSRKPDKKEPELYQYDWADANMLYENILLSPKGSGMHAVYIAKASEDYNSQGRKTGTYKPQMQKNTPYMVNFWLQMRKEIIEREVPREIKGKKLPPKKVEEEVFAAVIEGSGFDKGHEGKVLLEPSFEKLEMLARREEPEGLIDGEED